MCEGDDQVSSNYADTWGNKAKEVSALSVCHGLADAAKITMLPCLGVRGVFSYNQNRGLETVTGDQLLFLISPSPPFFSLACLYSAHHNASGHA